MRQSCGRPARRKVWFSASVLAALLLVLLPLGAPAEKIEQLKPQGYVNDFAGVLDAGARAQLTALCAEVDQKAHAQIAVVTVASLEGLPAQEFGNRLFKQWGVGYKPGDRGVLILLAPRDRKYWAEVGYGLEPILPDGKVGGFWREVVPQLRQSDFSGALTQFTSRVAEVIAKDRGVTLGSRVASRPRRSDRPPRAIIGFILFFIVALLLSGFLSFLRAFMGGGKSKGRRGGLLGWWLLGSGMGGGGGWGGGGFGGGGGGFGGFGGGASGGGGAGGSW